MEENAIYFEIEGYWKDGLNPFVGIVKNAPAKDHAEEQNLMLVETTEEQLAQWVVEGGDNDQDFVVTAYRKLNKVNGIEVNDPEILGDPTVLEKLQQLKGSAQSHYEDLVTGLDDGTYEDGSNKESLEHALTLDVAQVAESVKRDEAMFKLAQEYSETDMDALDFGEKVRELYGFK